MLAMARALMPDPQILLLDEPSAGLAPAFVEAIFDKIAEINPAGVTLVMVEQNARRALAMSNRGYVLDLGQNRSRARARSCLTTRRSPSSTSAARPARQAEPDERPEMKRPGLSPRPSPIFSPLLNVELLVGASTRLLSMTSSRAAPVTVDVVDTCRRVPVGVHVDRAGSALVVDVLPVLERLDGLGQLLPGVRVPGGALTSVS